MGKWLRLSATNLFLTLCQPRVWGLFLKVRNGMGPKAVESWTNDLTEALDILKLAMCTGHEPLKDILDRIPDTKAVKAVKPQKEIAQAKIDWAALNLKFHEKHGLMGDGISVWRDEFL